MPTPASFHPIVACYAIANEEDHIADSIRSVKPYVDRFVVIDSIFESNPQPSTHSTDRTREIVEDLCSSHPAIPCLYASSEFKLTELMARNSYLNLLNEEEGEWAFIVDGDEIVLGDYTRAIELTNAIRSGQISHSVSIPVYTVAVNVPKSAPAITAHEFSHAPLISTMGLMPRLVEAQTNLRYTAPRKASTPALTFFNGDRGLPDQYLLPAHHSSFLQLVNNHHRQSLESYLNDYEWETKGVIQ